MLCKSYAVVPLEVNECSEKKYDAFVGTVGFEERARYFCETVNPPARHRFALAFPDRHVLSFEENMRWYTEHEYTVRELDSAGYREWCRDELGAVGLECRGQLSLCVDISSMSRHRIASIVVALAAKSLSGTRVEVDFV